ncbi:30S ribosome-binding factor RbfA [bacterium]|nr:30S ribosome-binding factor RbfA [bacterium]
MTQKKTYRIKQVNRLLQEEIANIILMELQDERTNDMAITEVRTSKDLKHAVVFVSTHLRDKGEEQTEILRQTAGYIRRLLNRRIRLKYIPQLDFKYDDSLDKAERIFQQLESIDTGLQDENEDNTE